MGGCVHPGRYVGGTFPLVTTALLT